MGDFGAVAVFSIEFAQSVRLLTGQSKGQRGKAAEALS
jgi:hypothetical protein